MKNKAFTLAEVLITLGIIGVVAAITLPSVIQNYQKQVTVNKLKKVYTVLNQAIKLSETENGEYIYWDKENDIGATAYFEKYFKPYLETTGICKDYSTCGYESKTPWIAPNNTRYCTFLNNKSRIPIILKDGTLVLIVGGTSSATQNFESNEFWIDLNGSKSPNKIGKDFFVFVRTANGVKPYCYDNSVSDTDKNCLSGNGYCCSAKIMHDNWKIEKDYPW